jgi:hypothetical protein
MSKKIILPLLTACQTVIVYLAIIIPLEYGLTEKFLLIPSISPNIKTVIFILTLLIVFSVNFFNNGFYKTGKKLWFVWPVLFILMIIFNHTYTSYYQRIIQEPRIYSLSSNWGIQMKTIEIHGRNFSGEDNKQGEVKLEDYNLDVKEWTPEYIEVQIPMMPEFIDGYLYVITAGGEETNKVPFSVRDPAFLEELYNEEDL